MSEMSKDLNKKIKLEDLIPEESSFDLNGKTYHLRPFNLEDDAWMKRKFGQEKIQKMFDSIDMSQLSVLVYRLIKEKDQFPPVEIDDYDDDGNKIKRTLTGPENMLRSMQGGMNQTLTVFYALCQTIGISKPLLDKLTEEELLKQQREDLEKKPEGSQSPTESQTGESSLKSSPQSTATP